MNGFSSLPTYRVPVLYVLDHDSTRGLTRAAMARLKQLATTPPYGLDLSAMEAAHQAARAAALAFDALQYVRQGLADRPHAYEQFKAEFIAGNPGEVVYPEIPAFDRKLNTFPAVPHLVLTAGSHEFQQLKLEASGYHGYAKIVPVGDDGHTSPKGPVIASWQSANGSFEVIGLDKSQQPVARYIAGRAHLIDDKAMSFYGLPANCTGSMVTHESFGDIRAASQGTADDLPHGIEVIDSLADLTVERSYETVAGTEVGRIIAFVPLADFA